jgi:hypothetical protein
MMRDLQLALDDRPTMARDTPTRPAAATMIVRDGADGLEVLLLRRSPEASFMPGSWVFPGGVLEPGDVQLALDTGVGAAVAADWAARFGDDDPGLAPAFGVDRKSVV